MSVNSHVRKHSGYEAARSGAAFFIYPQAGYLRIFGKDRLDFLQRQTTNDVMTLQPGRVLMTVLTSPTARILDVFYLFMDEGDSLGLITLPGYADKTRDFLKKRIFFKDQVTLTDLSHDFLQLDFFGTSVSQSLHRIGIEFPADRDGLAESTLDGEALLIFSRPDIVQGGYRLLIRIELGQKLIDALHSADVVQLTGEEYEVLRVESGLPAAGRELSEEYTPLEVHLDEAISKDKGCYTGQEVIARQINYDKITKQMVGLHLESVVPSQARIHVEDKNVGEVASVVDSPRFGTIALAFIKRPYHEPGTHVDVMDGSKRIMGLVYRLPFTE